MLESPRLPDESAPDGAPPGRRERKKREVRRRIYEAAFALFLEKGFDATTVDEIAERADVGKGTVFNYFPRKTSFLAALAGGWTSQLVDEFGPVTSWRGSTRRQLERAYRFLADLGARNAALSRLALVESLSRLHGGGGFAATWIRSTPPSSSSRPFSGRWRVGCARGETRGRCTGRCRPSST
jgi:AcrR family transcriptional regulator